MNYADYEGNWEEHTTDNEYSIDAMYEEDITLSKSYSIHLIFDIDKGETIVEIK